MIEDRIVLVMYSTCFPSLNVAGERLFLSVGGVWIAVDDLLVISL